MLNQKMIWAAIAMLPLLGCGNASSPTSSTPATPGLHGAVWLDQGNGESNVVRGLTIRLCNPDHADMFQFIAPADSFSTSDKVEMTQTSFETLTVYANPNRCPYTATTDVDGKFSLSAPDGEYLVVALHQSPSLLAGWIFSTTVTGTTELNLNDANSLYVVKQ